MAKIVLDTVTGGYDLSVINNNFDKIETEFQNKVLYRNNPVGEANTLETDVDANGKRIYNLPEPLLDSEPARLQDLQNAVAGAAANLITFTPYGHVAGNNVQAAVQELIDDTTNNGVTLPAFLKDSNAIVVDNITALKAIDKTKFSKAQVLGHYTKGDGGGGIYWFDSTDTASADNSGTIIVATDLGRWKLFNPGTVSVRQFGAKGDGSTDDLTAITAAITAVSTAGGGAVLIPAGSFKISASLVITVNNVRLRGESKGASKIIGSFAAGDIVSIGDGTANPNNIVIEHLSITSSVAKSSGAALRFRNGHNVKANDVRMDTNLFKGVVLDGGASQFGYSIENFEIGASSVGLEIGAAARVADAFIRNGIIGGGVTGISMKDASGCSLAVIDVLTSSDVGIALTPGNGQMVASCFFDTVLGDTCTVNGWRIAPTGTGAVFDCVIEKCWGSSTTTSGGVAAGLYIDGPSATAVTNLQFSNFRAVNNKGVGVLVGSAGKYLCFNSCIVSANSQAGSAIHPGFLINGNLTDIQIIGGVYGGANNLPQYQSYGIQFGGTCDYIQIIGANTRGNVSGGVSNSSSGVNNVVANNV